MKRDGKYINITFFFQWNGHIFSFVLKLISFQREQNYSYYDSALNLLLGSKNDAKLKFMNCEWNGMQ